MCVCVSIVVYVNAYAYAYVVVICDVDGYVNMHVYDDTCTRSFTRWCACVHVCVCFFFFVN